MFKTNKTKPKYSIRKYSIGAASALIGFMAFTSGHTVQAEEAQLLTEGNGASTPAQTPQTASSANLTTSEPQAVEAPVVPQTASQPVTTDIVETTSPITETASVDQNPTAQASPLVETKAEPSQPQVLTNGAVEQGQVYATEETGAKMPYSNQSAEDAQLENGATVKHSTDMESTAVEATNQTYVELPQKDAAVTFQVSQPANALNVRYTIPDGESGELDVQVNGTSVGSLDLSSHSAWQYLKGDHEYDQPVEGGSARFRFDETRLLLKDVQLKAGDKLSLVKKRDDQVAYGIDFIELEQAPEPIAQGENSINILDKGASANDDGDDTAALLAAVDEAKATGKSVYIPQGRFNFDKQVNIEADNLQITGAGVWYTSLHFTSDKRYGGGIVFGHNSNGIELSHVYMDSNLTSRYNEDAQYKAISGTLGKDSKIHDVWVQHFEVGMWIGDYDQTGNMKYTDGLVVENARIRNNLADGINFAQGTKNSTVKYSNIRGNGDDGLAIWSSISDGTDAAVEENNKFLNNTIEAGWRAAGIGIFGGKGHEVAGNLIKDTFAGAGIRVNTVFAGHNFDLNDSGIKIHDNTLLRTGTTNDLYNQHRGAIDFQQVRGTIKNLDVYDNKLLNTLTDTAITNNFGMVETGNGEIRLSNNTIDNRASVGERLQDSSTNVTSESQSQTLAETVASQESSETPLSESEVSASENTSDAPASETSTSEVAFDSETSSSQETSASTVTDAPASEGSTEVISEAITSETSTSEESTDSETSSSQETSASTVTDAPASEGSTEVISEAITSETSTSEVAFDSETASSQENSANTVSDTPVIEGSTEVISEAITSETSTSEVASDSETASSQEVSETPSSEEVKSDTASETELRTSMGLSSELPSSTSQISVDVHSEVNQIEHSQENMTDPIREVASENIQQGSTSQVLVKISETIISEGSSEALSQQSNSQVMMTSYATKVVASEALSEAAILSSLMTERPVQELASELMARLTNDDLASVAATVSSSEGIFQEVKSELAEVVGTREETKGSDSGMSSKLVAGTIKSKNQSKESKVEETAPGPKKLFIVGIGVAATLSLSYLGVQVKKSKNK